MKAFITLCLVVALAGCQTTLGDIDAAIQKSAPQACQAVTVGYTAFVATGLGSDKDKATVAAAYGATNGICADPSHATAAQVASLAVQLGIILKTMRKVKSGE